MTSGAESMAVLMVVCTVPLVGLAIHAARNWDKPGARGFFLCQIGAIGWSIQLALLAWPGQLLPVHLNTTIRFLFQFLVVFGWPLLIVEYTRRQHVTFRRWVVAALLIVPVVTLVLAATNPRHHLVLDPATPVDPAGIGEFVLGPWYLVFVAFAVCVAVLPVGILLSELGSAGGTQRRQILLLLGGWAFGFPGTLQTYLFRNIDAVPPYVDLTPLAFTVAALLWGIALFRYHLFSAVPISRRTTVEMMAEPVIAVNADRIVIDANPAAHELFGTADSDVKSPLSEFCSEHSEFLAAFDPGRNRDAELALSTADGSRHFLLNVHPIALPGSEDGSVLVLRDVTRLREREQELDLLKRVLSRVFRHNVRNSLTVLEGQTRAIVERDENHDYEAQTSKILETTDRLLAHSEKATEMGRIIDVEETDRREDVSALVRRELESFRDRQPDVTVTASIQDGLHVRCHVLIEQAIHEVLRNAVVHFDGAPADLTIDITTKREGSQGDLVIADNGSGVDDYEVKTLESGKETPLEHGSGVGLWMVHLLVWKSAGTLTIDRETRLGGTRVKIALPLSDASSE